MDAPAVAMDPGARRRAGRGVRCRSPAVQRRGPRRGRAGGVHARRHALRPLRRRRGYTPAEFVDPADAEAALDVLVAAVCALAVR